MATFKYVNVTGRYDCGDRGIEYEGDEFEYTPEYEDLLHALAVLAIGDYLGKGAISALSSHSEYENAVEGFERMISDYDLEDSMVDYYYDELKEWFEEEAMATFD